MDPSSPSYCFPEGGWECGKCQNYNFKGRKECFRCKKGKDSDDYEGKPQHMFLPANEKAAIKAAKGKKTTKPKVVKDEPEVEAANPPPAMVFDQQKENNSIMFNNLNTLGSFASQNAPVRPPQLPQST